MATAKTKPKAKKANKKITKKPAAKATRERSVASVRRIMTVDSVTEPDNFDLATFETSWKTTPDWVKWCMGGALALIMLAIWGML